MYILTHELFCEVVRELAHESPIRELESFLIGCEAFVLAK